MDYKYEWGNGIFVNSVFWSGRNFPLYVIEKETGVKQSFGHVRKDEVKGAMMIMNPNLRDDYEFWKFACSTAPDICCYVPRKFHTSELLKIIAENTSWKENLQWMDIDKVEQEAGREAVEEIYSIMAARFYEAISDIPEEYLTDKVVNQALINHVLALSKLPVEHRNLERCLLSVSTWGKSLRSVPDDKKCALVETKDGEKKLYEVALTADPLAFKYVPVSELSSEMCLKYLKEEPSLISSIPAKMITPELVEKMNQNKIVFSPRERCYIKNSLKVWADFNDVVKFNTELDCEEDAYFSDIKLTDIECLFNKKVVLKLNRNGIVSVGQLLALGENPERLDSLFSGDTRLELMGTINILNCKFRGINPELDLDSSDSVYMQTKMGLPRAFAREVSKRGLSIKKLLEHLELPYNRQIWNRFTGWERIGEGVINSSIERLEVISDYYHFSDDKKRDAEIAYHRSQLEQLKQHSLELNNKISETINKIRELEEQKSMNDGVGYVKK